MAIAFSAAEARRAAPAATSRRRLPPGAARVLFTLVVVTAAAAGLVAAHTEEAVRVSSSAGTDLTLLLRFMAILKAVMTACAAAAILWRFDTAITLRRFAAYTAAGGAAAAGPGLIWSMAHVGSGALLVDGGLLATLVLLWRDPAVSRRIAAAVTARRR